MPVESPLKLTELESPRRPHLRSPFADVFNNFWASFSTPNDTLRTPSTKPSERPSRASKGSRHTTQTKPSPFVSTPFNPVSFEASTVSVQRSIASSLSELKIQAVHVKDTAKSGLYNMVHVITEFILYIARYFFAIPLVCFIGVFKKISYKSDLWGSLCIFALEKNNTALYKYRRHVKRYFWLFFLLSGFLLNFAYSMQLSNELRSNSISLKGYVSDYIATSHKSFLELINDQIKQIAQPKEPRERKASTPIKLKQLSPNAAHLFKISTLSTPAVVYPNNILGSLGLQWQYASYPPTIVLEDGQSVVGKNFCVYDAQLKINLTTTSSFQPKFISIRWPLTVNKPTQYRIMDVVLQFTITTEFETVDIFQILPNSNLEIEFIYTGNDDFNCIYKIGLHSDYK